MKVEVLVAMEQKVVFTNKVNLAHEGTNFIRNSNPAKAPSTN